MVTDTAASALEQQGGFEPLSSVDKLLDQLVAPTRCWDREEVH
jgi:hypothetical protein